MCSATGIDARNMLVIFEIGINSLMLMGHPYKKNKCVFYPFLVRESIVERNDSIVLLGELMSIVHIHKVETITRDAP